MGAAKEIKCTVCQKSFACRRYVVKHLARVHSKEKEERKPLECAICGKDFPRLSHLQRHQLIHIKEREWGCPFCEQRFVQKPHLTRHIGRCHASQSVEGLNERISANKWRTEGQPVIPNFSKNNINNSSSMQCSRDLIPCLLCLTCGSTFSNRTDFNRHVTNAHRLLKCKHCGDICNGYTKLKRHELHHRAHTFICGCGASFKRQAELRTHRDSCRKCGSFLCLVCEEVFVQRVQLDRHWNKRHFTNAQCDECGWISTAPLRIAQHALQVHKKTICGYCGSENPFPDHIATLHWKRLKRSIPIRNATKTKCTIDGNRKPGGSVNAQPFAMSPEHDEESSCQGNVVAEINESVTATNWVGSTAFSSSYASSDIPISVIENAPDYVVSESEISEVNARMNGFLNVILSIPDDVVDEFHFGDRLPDEVLRLFPEFSSARVSVLEPFVGQQRFLSLQIPVPQPLEGDEEMERLLSTPIYI